MPIRIRDVNNISILDIDGRIDINSSDLVEMVGWLVNSGKTNMVLNMENVDLIDYNGLSILAIAYKNVLNHKGKMKFLNVPLAAIELFKIVKLESVFEIYDDETAAVNSFYDQEIDKLALRRKFPRLDIHIGVKYSILADQKKPKLFDGVVLNISAAGLYIHTPYTFPMNSLLNMEFVIPSVANSLEATGRVSWLADKEIQPHVFPGMGVSFTHLTPEKEKSIVDFIDKNVTHRADTI
jgi:anti-sigma B factor antagonist